MHFFIANPLCQVNAADLSNDSDAKFMAEFYKNLKILSQDLYKKSAVAQTNFRGAKDPPPQRRASKMAGGMMSSNSRASFMGMPADSDMMNSANLAALAMDGSTRPSPMLAESAFQTHPADYFTSDSLMERMKIYAQQGGIPVDYVERYANSSKQV